MRLLVAEDDSRLLKTLTHLFEMNKYLVDGVDSESDTAEIVGGVDSVPVITRDRHERVTQEGGHLDASRFFIVGHDDHRVASASVTGDIERVGAHNEDVDDIGILLRDLVDRGLAVNAVGIRRVFKGSIGI